MSDQHIEVKGNVEGSNLVPGNGNIIGNGNTTYNYTRVQINIPPGQPPAEQAPKSPARQHALKRSIAQIHRSNGTVAGMGFLMGEQHVVTCAHVVRAASGDKNYADLRGLTVPLDFPYVEDAPDGLQATVVALSHPSLGEGQDDIAILKLNAVVAGSTPAPVIQGKDLEDHRFETIGVPYEDSRTGERSWLWSKGAIGKKDPEGKWQLTGEETGPRITRGFSGAPLWDDDLQGVVGMVRASIEGKEASTIRAAFAIPMAKIANLFQRELPDVSLQWLSPEALPPTSTSRQSPPIISVPNVEETVARAEAEIARARLKTDGRLLIVGAPGVGKTVLGAQVAQDLYPKEDILWYDFTPGTVDFHSVSWKLADFLAQRGDATILYLLQAQSQAEEAIDAARLQTALVNAFRGRDYLLCFDNARHVLHAPEQERDAVLGLFRAFATQIRPSRLLLMSRERFPDDLPIPDLTLRGMGQDDFRKLILHYLPEFPADEPVGDGSGRTLAQLAWERLGGNPQYLCYFAGSVASSQPLEVAGVLEVLHALPEKDVGSYLTHQVYEKNLNDEERNVLTTAALFRRPPEVSLLAEVLLRGHLVEKPQPVIHTLADTRFLYDITGGRIVVHDLTKEYFISMLGADASKERHHLIAEAYAERESVISRGEEAYHRLQAGEPVYAYRLIEENFQDLLAAGQAGALLAVMEGLKVTHFEDFPEMWPRVLFLRGQLRNWLGRYRLAAADYKKALEAADEAGDTDRSIRARLELARVHINLRNYAQALEHLEPLREELLSAPRPDHTLLGRFCYELGAVYYELHDLDKMRECVERSIEALSADKRANAPYLLKSYALASGLYQQDPQYAIAAVEKATELAAEAGLSPSAEMALVHANAAYAYMLSGELPKAEDELRQTLAIAERIYDWKRQVLARLNLGDVLSQRGKIKEAAAVLERAREIVEQDAGSPYRFYVHHHLAILHLEQGRWEEAEAGLEKAREATKRDGDKAQIQVVYGYLWRDRAHLALARRDPDEAEQCRFNALLNLGEESERYFEEAHPLVKIERDIALADALAVGDDPEALRTAEEKVHNALAAARDGQIKPLQYQARQVQGLILAKQGRWQEADRAFREAIGYYRGQHNTYELARTNYYFGLRYLAAGDDERARRYLDKSLTQFRSLTAEGHENQYVRLVEATLMNIGAAGQERWAGAEATQ